MKHVLLSIVAICSLMTTRVTAAEEPLAEVEIKQLLAKALACNTIQDAEPLLNQARLVHASSQMRLTNLKAAFLLVDIDQAEGRICARQGVASDDPLLRSRAIQLLNDCIVSYDRHAEDAQADAEELRSRFRWGATEKSQRWREIKGYRSRANYAKAWCWYGIGLASTDLDREHAFEQAIDLFQRFTLAGYNGNEIAADCFLGQALCMYEMRRHYDLVTWLETSLENTPLTQSRIWPRLFLIKCKAYNSLRFYLQLELNCRRYLQSKSSQSDDSLRLQIMVMRFDALRYLTAEDNPYRDAYIADLEFTAEYLYAQENTWRDYVIATLASHTADAPLVLLARAKKFLSEGSSEKSASAAQQGIAVASENTSSNIVKSLRYIYCLALSGTDRKLEFINSVAECLHNAADETEVQQLATLATSSLMNVFNNKQITPEQALALLQTFGASSDSSQVKMHTDYATAVILMQTGDFTQAWQGLTKMNPPDDSLLMSYLFNRALAGLKAAQHVDDEREHDSMLDDSLKTFDRMYKLVSASSPEDTDLRTAQLGAAIGAELFAAGNNTEKVLDLCRRIEKLPSAEAVADQLMALRVQAHIVTDSEDDLVAYLQELAKNTDAGAAAARALVKAVDALATSPSPEHTLQIYETAYKLLIDAKDEVADDPKLQIYLRLAKSYSSVGQHEKAVEVFEGLLASHQLQTAEVLETYAVSLQSAGKFTTAAEQWNRLAKGLQLGSEQWYHANYNLFNCTYKSGQPEMAAKMLDYYLLKFQSRLDPHWIAELKSLREKWNE